MINTEKTLEFDKIKEKLEELACTEGAKQKIRALVPYLAETEVLVNQRETTEAKHMLDLCGNPPATALQGIGEWVDMAGKGGCLNPEQLEIIAAVLAAVRRWKDYLSRGRQLQISLAYYEENLDSLEEISREINEKIRGGRIDDYASGQLKSLREAISRTDEKMRGKAEDILRANKSWMSDSFCTQRNGHLCIPVKKEYKGKINGAVIDKSATGSTLFVEPAPVAKLFSQLQELKIDEENEERRILYTLSGLLAEQAEPIAQNSRTLEKLDFVFAKAKLSMEYDGIQPKINTGRLVRLKNARHPLMDKSTNIPLNLELGGDIRGIVITGPNTGGKTVAIKTVALNCMMAQCGLHVACEEAEICMNNAILCDIGDGQDISENLSTFSAHITNVLEILKNVTRQSLVVMDELGSGTDPAEGMGIAIAILEELKNSGALFLATTHYPEVKEYAGREAHIVNARMTFDRESLKPLYQMVIGEAGESCAFYIAGRLGMPKSMLERAAKAAYGEQAAKAAYGEQAATVAYGEQRIQKNPQPKIRKKKQVAKQEAAQKYLIGDSVMVLPEQKIGIVCQRANEKGMLRVQLPGEKIWISHKRLRLHVSADQLYPEDYDFSVIFDSVEKRKATHEMERKYVEQAFYHEE